MALVDLNYSKLGQEILNTGRWYVDESRENTHRLQIPSHTFKHNFLHGGFPALNLRELKWNSVVTELIWFLRGDTNIKYLVDNKNPIWNKDAYNWYKKVCKERGLYEITFKDFVRAIKAGETMESLVGVHGGMPDAKFNYKLGDVGKNYSRQWRSYAGQVDQIVDLIKNMRSNIMSTRLKVEAWNPAEVKDTALPPCHTGFQIVGIPLSYEEQIALSDYSDEEWSDTMDQDLALEALDHIPNKGFELHWNQRSVDTYLGLPFNIASYAALAKFLEALTKYKAIGIQGDLKCVHLYDNSIDATKEVINRDFCSEACDIKINLPENYEKMSFDELINKMEAKDFQLVNYEHQGTLSVEMKAPKEI